MYTQTKHQTIILAIYRSLKVRVNLLENQNIYIRIKRRMNEKY